MRKLTPVAKNNKNKTDTAIGIVVSGKLGLASIDAIKEILKKRH